MAWTASLTLLDREWFPYSISTFSAPPSALHNLHKFESKVKLIWSNLRTLSHTHTQYWHDNSIVVLFQTSIINPSTIITHQVFNCGKKKHITKLCVPKLIMQEFCSYLSTNAFLSTYSGTYSSAMEKITCREQ